MELRPEEQWDTLLWIVQKRIVATEEAIQKGKEDHDAFCY